MKKVLTTIVILLFIGVAFAPSINANIRTEDDLVEFDVEFCGLGQKHKVKLTQQEADEVEKLFDDVEKRLSEVETREEAEEIFKETVVELDKYGLLGDLTVHQAQQLIVGSNIRKNLLSYHFTKNTNHLKDNFFLNTYNCFSLLVAFGDVGYPISIQSVLLIFLVVFLYINTFDTLLELLEGFIENIYIRKLFCLYSIIPGFQTFWMYTLGLQGYKYSEGGHFHIFGFSGLRIWVGPYENAYYLGLAFRIYQ